MLLQLFDKISLSVRTKTTCTISSFEKISNKVSSMITSNQETSSTLKTTKGNNGIRSLQTALVAAACAGSAFVVESFCYPFDTVKVRIQATKDQFLPYFKTVKHLYQTEGPKTFFKGYSGLIPCTFVAYFGWFFAYEKCNLLQMNFLNSRNLSPDDRKRVVGFAPLISGIAAEIVSMSIYVPFTIPKVRMQVDNPKYHYKNIVDGLIKVYRTEGKSTFTKTFELYSLVNITYSGVAMLIYENFRNMILEKKKKNALDIKETLTVTFFTSLCCHVFMNPAEVIITRYIITAKQAQKVSPMKIAKELIKKEGVVGFYKGLPGRIIWGAANSFVYMPTFEYFRTHYGVKLE